MLNHLQQRNWYPPPSVLVNDRDKQATGQSLGFSAVGAGDVFLLVLVPALLGRLLE
jgi:hypothetical protein